METLEPIMAVSGEVMISGVSIVNDLCDKIAEKLERSCDLRSTDAYRSYAARVSITLQLIDVDTTEVAAQVDIGTMDPAQPTEHVSIDVAGVAVEAPSLEKPIDPSGFNEASPQKRLYVSRRRAK